ncbi:hypothetical protein [Streptomyces aurantiogriseus]|uniref:Uncharacterized protein n=1 Tax=Streptomyces aurantiogriseus TaxID=66870 RepID=A0A918C7B2_9ACTN|nr:hypothetical protein [Streptomyces aurantiogriseus]GGR10478.1 hypothetical protein GCM10010251_28010 [Streptomyces aurantiogriseus]
MTHRGQIQGWPWRESQAVTGGAAVRFLLDRAAATDCAALGRNLALRPVEPRRVHALVAGGAAERPGAHAR